MFVSNNVEEESLLSAWAKILGEKKLEALKAGKGFSFYQLIFNKIEEVNFSGLYSIHLLSAPNSPVNRLLSAVILQHQRNWSFSELESQLDFNIEVRVALGMVDLETKPFSMRTLFNFKNRLASHQERTGVDLIKNLFEDLTKDQLKRLKIKTGIQRGDTVLLNSNMTCYTRLSLLVEVLKRLHTILTQEDKELYSVWFSPYIKGGEKYVYEVKSQENKSHLEKLSVAYYGIMTSLEEKYGNNEIFKVFERAYQDHFKKVETEDKVLIEVRPSEELDCHTLQSPDDTDATFKKKREEKYQGYSALGLETCHPDNKVNLITHLNAYPNQADDGTVLAEELDRIMEKTPDLNECHVDGGFGCPAVDNKSQEHKVTIIQTAVKGNIAKVPIKIEGNEEIGFTVTCPNPEQPPAEVIKLKKSYKANFDLNKCETCPFKDNCPAKKKEVPKKGVAVFRFNEETVLRQQRHRAILKIPKERRTLRSGVENLMGLMHRCEKHTGKLKIRGLLNCKLYVFAMGIAINFERIYRYSFAFYAFYLLSRFRRLPDTKKYAF